MNLNASNRKRYKECSVTAERKRYRCSRAAKVYCKGCRELYERMPMAIDFSGYNSGVRGARWLKGLSAFK